ncbi:Ribokinase-like protein [Gigaspora rosea]|uniref:Ribokinase-like protein n=1 Tax=Gigaspora rosea TaxID=44941 RepID=A0A397VB63_9GLOM|nr:Ribokinase-like protein [Gigaspora rosea]
MVAKYKQIPLKILVIGTAHEDVILYVDKLDSVDSSQGSQKIEKRVGGSAGNTLAVLSQFPMTKTWLMAPMASKEASKFLVQDFESRNIKTATCVFRPNVEYHQVTYFIHTEDENSRTVVNYNSIKELTFEEFKRKLDYACTVEIASLNTSIPFNWIHLEGHHTDAKKMVDYIDSRVWRNQSILSIRLDRPYKNGSENLIQKADIIFFSHVFAESKGYNRKGVYDFLKVMSRYCKDNAYLFCTWGSCGAFCYDNKTKRIYYATALQAPIVVDSIGADDTFVACAIYSLVQRMSPEGCLRFACELSSRKCAQFGFDGIIDEMNVLFRLFDRSESSSIIQSDSSSVIQSDSSSFIKKKKKLYNSLLNGLLRKRNAQKESIINNVDGGGFDFLSDEIQYDIINHDNLFTRSINKISSINSINSNTNNMNNSKLFINNFKK